MLLAISLPDSTTVQAWSAVVIMALTGVLAWSTWKYAKAAESLNEEAQRTNDLAAKNFERAVLRDAPVLIFAEIPDVGKLPDGRWVLTVTLWNGGNTNATDIKVATDWGEYSFNAVIPPGLDGRIKLSSLAEPPPDAPGPNPVAERFEFRDPGGTLFTQSVGGRPLIVESDGRA